MTSLSSGPGLAESLLLVVGVPHTLTLALGVLRPGNPLEEAQREKSTGLEAILGLDLISSLRTSLNFKGDASSNAVVLVRNELAQVGHKSRSDDHSHSTS